MTDELLDASLREQLGSTEDGENALILPSKKAKKHKKQRETETRRHAQMQMSKSKLKKLAKKEERRIKKTKRGELIANLRTHSATQEQLKLMKGVGTVGSAMTRRQLMHRALLRERAGIATEEDTGLLYRPRRGMRGGAMAMDEEDAEEEEDSEDEEVGEEEAKGGEKTEVKGLKVEKNHGNSAAHKQIPHTSVVTEKRADALKSGPKATESVAKVPKVASLSDARKRGVEGARAVFVNVDRPMEVQKARMALPVCRSEQEVMEAVASHDVVVLCSETGSGKTTQVPQFLYEAGYGRSKSGRPGVVGVTQPRRVAATAMAARVAHELGQVCGGDEGEVAYQVRYDRSTVTSRTVIKFMTDGVLLRELQSDVLLRGYSAILLDEVHERGLNTDLLLGALSRVVTLRRQLAAEHGTLSAGKRGRPGAPQMQPGAASGPGGLALTRADGALASDRRGRAWTPYPLKVIIMSATLRTDELTQNPRLFHPPPPVVRIGSRQHPVTIHFSKRTEMEEYVNKAIRKTATIHKRLPPGGILVFLTGRQEIDYAVAELRRRLRVRKSRRTAPLPAPTSGNEPNPEKITTEDELTRESVAGLALDAEDEADLDATAISDAAEADGSPKVGNVPTHGNGGSDDDVDEDGVDDDDDDDENVQILRNGDGQLGAIEHQRKDDSGFPDGEEDDDDENEWGSSSGPDSKTTAVAEAAAAWAVREDPGSDPFSGLNIDYGDGAAAAAVRGKTGSSHTAEHVHSNPAVAVPSIPTTTAVEGKADEEEETPAFVVPLYSMLSQRQQARAFRPPPPGHRLIVVATDVAETSLTIPGVTYVVDSGRHKARVYDTTTGSSRFEVQWITQASAMQRAGRAGRTGPGHCYRLYSAAFFNDRLAEWGTPEISTRPLDSLALQMKAMGVARVQAFPFPSPPPPDALRAALLTLCRLGALQRIESPSSTGKDWRAMMGLGPRKLQQHRSASTGGSAAHADGDGIGGESEEVDVAGTGEEVWEDEDTRISPLGTAMLRYPVAPRFAKMLVLAERHTRNASISTRTGVLAQVIAIVSALSVQAPFVRPSLPRAAAQTTVSAPVGSDAAEDAAASRRRRERQDREAAGSDDDSEADSDADSTAGAVEEDEVTREWVAARAGKLSADLSPEEADRERRRAARAAADVSHARWRHPESDALTLLRVVGAYSHAVRLSPRALPAAPAFCKEHFLHAKTMREVHDLRNQLTLAVNRAAPRPEDTIPPPHSRRGCCLSPPSEARERLLRQLVVAGSLDRIARVDREALGDAASLRHGWVPYRSCDPRERRQLFIHPRSSVRGRDGRAPAEFVAYQEVIEGRRPYMVGITLVDPDRLASLAAGTPMCRLGAPLSAPPPSLEPKSGVMYCWVQAAYGAGGWELPAFRTTMPAGRLRAKHFARALLAGEVVPEFARLASDGAWAMPPAALVRDVTLPRCSDLVRVLHEQEDVGSVHAFVGALRARGEVLVGAVTQCAHKKRAAEVRRALLAWAVDNGVVDTTAPSGVVARSDRPAVGAAASAVGAAVSADGASKKVKRKRRRGKQARVVGT